MGDMPIIRKQTCGAHGDYFGAACPKCALAIHGGHCDEALGYAMVNVWPGLHELSASFTIMARKLQLLAREARRREKRHRRNVKFKARRCATLILRSWQREGGKNPGRSHASIVRTVLREWRTLDARDGATR